MYFSELNKPCGIEPRGCCDLNKSFLMFFKPSNSFGMIIDILFFPRKTLSKECLIPETDFQVERANLFPVRDIV